MSPELSLKMAKLIQSIHKIRKDKTNPFYKSKYANIENILDQVKPLAKAQGLFITQPIYNNSVHTYFHCIETGECYPPFDTEAVGLTLRMENPQEKGKELTYFRRYGLVSTLGLEQEDDKDANTTLGQPTHNNLQQGRGIKRQTKSDLEW